MLKGILQSQTPLNIYSYFFAHLLTFLILLKRIRQEDDDIFSLGVQYLFLIPQACPTRSSPNESSFSPYVPVVDGPESAAIPRNDSRLSIPRRAQSFVILTPCISRRRNGEARWKICMIMPLSWGRICTRSCIHYLTVTTSACLMLSWFTSVCDHTHSE